MIFLGIFPGSFSFIQTWFTQGVLHPIMTPSHIILLLGLGLLAGQNSTSFKQSLLYTLSLALAVAVGMSANHYISLNWSFELILLIVALIVGILVILKLTVLQAWSYFILALGGLLVGYDSSPVVIPGLGLNSIYNWLAGAATTIIGLIFVITLVTRVLNRFWEGVLVRVIGSWITASALLTLTFMFVTIKG